MHGIDCIRAAFQTSNQLTLGLISDMKDVALTQPTDNGGNHPLWILGHLTYAEGQLIQSMMLGNDNPIAEWKDLFDGGTQPVLDAHHYPPFDDIMARFEQLRSETLSVLDGLDDAGLDTPSKNCPPDFAAFFGTYGLCMLNCSMHAMHHRGQVADARLKLGRAPLMG